MRLLQPPFVPMINTQVDLTEKITLEDPSSMVTPVGAQAAVIQFYDIQQQLES